MTRWLFKRLILQLRVMLAIHLVRLAIRVAPDEAIDYLHRTQDHP